MTTVKNFVNTDVYPLYTKLGNNFQTLSRQFNFQKIKSLSCKFCILYLLVYLNDSSFFNAEKFVLDFDLKLSVDRSVSVRQSLPSLVQKNCQFVVDRFPRLPIRFFLEQRPYVSEDLSQRVYFGRG